MKSGALKAVLLCVLLLSAAVAANAQIGDCCLRVDYGSHHPPNHEWTFDPAHPDRPNLMMHFRVCLPENCPLPAIISGFKLQATGTGDDANDIAAIRILVDQNCDGKPDGLFYEHTGGFDTDDGSLEICWPNNPVPLERGQCVCFMIQYVLKPDAKCDGTFQFRLEEILGGSICQPLPQCSDERLVSAVKRVRCPDECCLKVERGPNFPPDHSWQCTPGTAIEPNLMAEFRICNPCETTRIINGLRLKAGGSGNDATGIQKVLVWVDLDCDGKPEMVNALAGAYAADNGDLILCRPDGPLVRIPPNRCVCIRIYYLMDCNAPPGDYWFDLTNILSGPNCQPICAEELPIRSAIKKVDQGECCLVAEPGPKMPEDHVFQCQPGENQLNFMQQVRLCNPCPYPVAVSGVVLKAWGSGNDVTGIQEVVVQVDKDCDGDPDGPVITGKYTQDNGFLSLCTAAAPVIVLEPGQCICINVYYRMKCPDPVPGTYALEMVRVLGANCEPLCVEDLPIRSARKIIEPRPCCLEVKPGPNNPPSHSWGPGLPRRNTMFQFEVCNPCDDRAQIRCVTLNAFGTGNDATDILDIRVYVDRDCDGKVGPGDTFFGNGKYPADNGSVTICTNNPVDLGVDQCVCFLVEYIMSPRTKPGSTYGMVLAGIDAANVAGAQFCIEGIPLTSNIKRRCWRVGEVKLAPLGSRICLLRSVVTAVFEDRIYVQDAYRSSNSQNPDNGMEVPGFGAGIAVLRSPDVPMQPQVGQLVQIQGQVDVKNCEVVIVPEESILIGLLLPAVQNARMNNRSTGGGAFGNQPGVVDASDYALWQRHFSQQTNNVGMLVHTWGEVTIVGDYDGDGVFDSFYINDGSDLMDGRLDEFGFPTRGVLVLMPEGMNPPPEGAYVGATGIMRAVEHQGACIRALQMRSLLDLDVHSGLPEAQ